MFDGRYLYLVPNDNTTYPFHHIVARYDTTASFTTAAAWSMFDLTAANTKILTGFWGGVFDGRYVYMVPSGGSGALLVMRYDTTASFTTAAAWSTFDATTLDPNANDFFGAAFDGKYVYLVPLLNSQYTCFGAPADTAVALRFDSTASFTSSSSWSEFDVLKVNPFAGGFAGAAYDGRYVYFVPSGSNGIAARLDPTADFATSAAWSTFNIQQVDVNAFGFAGAAFDGQYIYMPGGGSIIARFHARSPAPLPKLPGWNGSFF